VLSMSFSRKFQKVEVHNLPCRYASDQCLPSLTSRRSACCGKHSAAGQSAQREQRLHVRCCCAGLCIRWARTGTPLLGSARAQSQQPHDAPRMCLLNPTASPRVPESVLALLPQVCVPSQHSGAAGPLPDRLVHGGNQTKLRCSWPCAVPILPSCMCRMGARERYLCHLCTHAHAHTHAHGTMATFLAGGHPDAVPHRAHDPHRAHPLPARGAALCSGAVDHCQYQ